MCFTLPAELQTAKSPSQAVIPHRACYGRLPHRGTIFATRRLPPRVPPLTWFLSLACNCNPQKCGEHLCSETPIEWSIAQRHDDTASSVISIIQATYRCERNAPCHRFAVRLTMQWGSWSTSAPRVSFQCIRNTTSTLPHRRSSSVLYSRVHGINSLSPSTPL